MHWGLGYYNNLSLNQFAVPYNSMSLELQLGPLSVVSFYGDLLIHNNSMSMQNKTSRNLYGHRYELSLSNLVFGISELQVLYDNNRPCYLFLLFLCLWKKEIIQKTQIMVFFDVAYHFEHWAYL